jgi:hypothetical protein
VGTERDAGLGVDKIGAEPSIKAIQNFIARILVLFVKDSSGGVWFHGALNWVEKAFTIVIRSFKEYLSNRVWYFFAIVNGMRATTSITGNK